MIKRILTLMLAVSVLAYCKPTAEQQGDPSANPSEEPSKEPASADPSTSARDYLKAAGMTDEQLDQLTAYLCA